MRGKLLATAISAMLAVSVVASGCGGGSKASDEIKIGVVSEMTGSNATYGTSVVNGMKLALKEVNDKGGVNGKKVSIVVADSKSEPAEAANAMSKLVNQDKTPVVMGIFTSSSAIAAANVSESAKVPFLAIGATNPKVTLDDKTGKVKPNTFRVCFIDPFQGTVMANYAYKNGARKVAIIQEVSNDYAVGLAKFFKEAFIKLTGNPDSVVEVANYQTGDKDFSAILTNIKAKNPDAVFAPGNFTESALLIKQARQLGLEVPFLGGDTWETQEFIDVGGKDVEGASLSTAFDREKATTEEAKKFLDAYVKEYKGEPSALTALAYDAYLIAIDGIKRAGTTTDSVKIRDAIAQTKDLETVTGKTTLDKNGDAIKAAIIKTVKDGKFKYLDFVDVK